MTDKEKAAAFDPSQARQVTGPQGSVLFIDAAILHRGGENFSPDGTRPRSSVVLGFSDTSTMGTGFDSLMRVSAWL